MIKNKNSIVYKISKEERLENDKKSLLTKFNFDFSDIKNSKASLKTMNNLQKSPKYNLNYLNSNRNKEHIDKNKKNNKILISNNLQSLNHKITFNNKIPKKINNNFQNEMNYFSYKQLPTNNNISFSNNLLTTNIISNVNITTNNIFTTNNNNISTNNLNTNESVYNNQKNLHTYYTKKDTDSSGICISESFDNDLNESVQYDLVIHNNKNIEVYNNFIEENNFMKNIKFNNNHESNNNKNNNNNNNDEINNENNNFIYNNNINNNININNNNNNNYNNNNNNDNNNNNNDRNVNNNNDNDSNNNDNYNINDSSYFDNEVYNYNMPQRNHRNLIRKIFKKEKSSDITSRLINCENDINVMKEKKVFKFIKNIREENNNIINFKINNFLKLNSFCMYNLLSFIYESYDILIEYKSLKNKIENTLNKNFEKFLKIFSQKYKDYLQITKHYFLSKKFTNSKKEFYSLNLIILLKVITKKKNINIEIGYSYEYNRKIYDIIWSFDIIDKNQIKIWFSSEIEVYNKVKKRFTYCSPISSFSYGDTIQIEVNIFSKNRNLNPFSIEIYDIKVFPLEYVSLYEKNHFISFAPYDPYRSSEIETLIQFWRTEGINKIFCEEFRRIFEKNFKINQISYDINKIYFYKINMVANKIGIIKKNNFINFQINIVPFEDNIQNEIQHIGLLNSKVFMDNINIRIGTNIIIYITDI